VGCCPHLELTTGTRNPIAPTPTADDLLVIYLEEPVGDDLAARGAAVGGTVVSAHNAYWDEGGVTIADPDGYRVVLTARAWGRNVAAAGGEP
jgi:hypothetical protein